MMTTTSPMALSLRYLLVLAATASVPGLAATPVNALDVRPVFESIAVRAIEHGPTGRQSAAQIEVAGFELDEARGRRWPQIDLGVQSALMSPTLNTGTPPSKAPVTTLSATTILFDWGRTSDLIDAAELGLQAARERHDATLANIVYEACTAFVTLVRRVELAALAESYAGQMAALVDMVAQVVAVDAGRTSELVQARARLLQAQALRDVARSRVAEAQTEMRKLVGDAIPPLPASAPWEMQLPDLQQAINGLAQSPAILAANADIRAAEQRAESVKASGMPALNLTVARPLRTDAYGRPPGWQVGLSLSMPLGRGGSISAATSAARERARADASRRDQLLIDLEYRIRNAHHEAYTSTARAVAYADLSIELEKVRENFFEQWLHLGKRSLLDVLNAQSDHYGNEVNAVSSRYDAYAASLKFRVSAGQLVPWVRGDAVIDWNSTLIERM
jgi:adhesin transport system outer membrane protein